MTEIIARNATIARERGTARIAIRDDGEGFAAERTPTLFQRGCSTRAHKSGGLGLHRCANAMAMHGGLKLESEGPGGGGGADAGGGSKAEAGGSRRALATRGA